MRKHVQTELSEATYARLRRRARAETRPIKDIVREAVEAYLQADDEGDPFEPAIGSYSIGGDWSTKKGWRDPFRKRRGE